MLQPFLVLFSLTKNEIFPKCGAVRVKGICKKVQYLGNVLSLLKAAHTHKDTFSYSADETSAQVKIGWSHVGSCSALKVQQESKGDVNQAQLIYNTLCMLT